MDVEKIIEVKEFSILGKTIFTLTRKKECNYFEDVEPLRPIVELNLNDSHNFN